MPELSNENLSSFKNLLTNIYNADRNFSSKRVSEIECILNDSLRCNEETDIKSLSIDYSALSNLNLVLNTIKCKQNINTLDKFQEIETIAKEKNKKESCDFNILRLFNIGETMHSYLLANILNPYSEHGQGNYFLLSFLKKIGIENPEYGQWIVTAEKGRIDVLLKRVHPHSIVVIENKSNFAIDQSNQLYRYWHQEIYYPNRHRPIEYTANHPEIYQIIYLTPADWKQPSTNTSERPKQWPLTLPERMPIEPIIWKFDKEVSDWLNLALEGISSENHRLKEYIKQYIEYWN